MKRDMKDVGVEEMWYEKAQDRRECDIQRGGRETLGPISKEKEAPRSQDS